MHTEAIFLKPVQTSTRQEENTLNAIAIETPIGSMLGIASEKALHLLEFAGSKGLDQAIFRLQKKHPANLVENSNNILRQVQLELEAYFKGDLKNFSTPFGLRGTPFQQSVWQALLQIPYAETRSYSEQAARIGKSSACRAVANANGANQIAILVPCHRIINHNGKSGGYAGGIERKEWLIAHEKKYKQD